MLKRTSTVLSLICSAVLAAVICISITGCEEESKMTDGFFANNPPDSAEDYTPGSVPISIIPDGVTARTVGEQIAVRAVGGHGPYSWAVGNAAVGAIVATTDDDAVYTVLAIAENSIVVSDRYNNKSSIQVTPSGAFVLHLEPDSAEIAVGMSINFLPTGGTPPYTFTVALPGLGTIDASGGYLATAVGTNVVYVTDNDGAIDGATVGQF